MIAIVNMGATEEGGMSDPGGLRTYEVRINQQVVCQFKHKRIDGLAVCLEKAAKAVRAHELKKTLSDLGDF